MNLTRGRKIYFHETDLFKNWMKEKGYVWPNRLISQENMVAEFMKELLTKKV